MAKSDRPRRMAYADPPYPGKAKLHYRHQPDYAGEVDFGALIVRLVDEFPDGWALSCNSRDLRDLLPQCPPKTRVAAWVKPWAVWKKNVYPAYSWEPVIFCGGRNRWADEHMVNDFLLASPAIKVPVTGAKPQQFSYWLFLLLGLKRGDELVDLFPGSGAVGRAWLQWQSEMWAA